MVMVFLATSIILPSISFASLKPKKKIIKTAAQIKKAKAKAKKKKEQAKKQALKKLEEKQKRLFADLAKITIEYNQAYTELYQLERQSDVNKKKLDITAIELDIKQENLNKRAVALYTSQEDFLLADMILNIVDFDQLVSELKFLRLIALQDADLVKDTKDLKKKVANRQHSLDTVKNQKFEVFKNVEQKADAIRRNLESQKLVSALLSKDFWLLQKREANIGKYNISLVFPVQGPHSYSDDWGEPRGDIPGGQHQGNDIFALTGTPVVAVTDGILTKVSYEETGLGGIRFWLMGKDGVHYYFAHLSRIAPGYKAGQVVHAGQVIGYVGNTGDARTTPPHLHFEMHPGDGSPINPYLFLRAADIY